MFFGLLARRSGRQPEILSRQAHEDRWKYTTQMQYKKYIFGGLEPNVRFGQLILAYDEIALLPSMTYTAPWVLRLATCDLHPATCNMRLFTTQRSITYMNTHATHDQGQDNLHTEQHAMNDPHKQIDNLTICVQRMPTHRQLVRTDISGAVGASLRFSSMASALQTATITIITKTIGGVSSQPSIATQHCLHSV